MLVDFLFIFLFQVNVWKFHDLYAVLGEDKPFKSGRHHDSQVFHRGRSRCWHSFVSCSGKCYKVPDGLDDGGKRKRKRPTSLQDFRSWFRGTCENFLSELFNTCDFVSVFLLWIKEFNVCVAVDPPEHKLKNGPTFTGLFNMCSVNITDSNHHLNNNSCVQTQVKIRIRIFF